MGLFRHLIFNARMLSKGIFLNLYITGYDVPEGYAIEKDAITYYAFFSPKADEAWKEEIELRGLCPGSYRVFDYVGGRELGTVSAVNPRLAVTISGHLLLEVSKQQP